MPKNPCKTQTQSKTDLGIFESSRIPNQTWANSDVGKNVGGEGLEWWREDKDFGLILNLKCLLDKAYIVE